MAQTPVKLGTFKDLLLDRQIEELVSYARSVAESTSGTAGYPTTISALTTAGGFGHVRLEYSYTSYNGHKYTEIWRSADTTFANAERVGATAAHFYQDFPPNPQISEVLFYWVRNVNMDGVEGDLFGPVAGSVGSDPEYNLDMLIGQLGFWHLQPGTLPVRSEPTFPTLPSVLYPVNSRIYLTTNQIVYKNVNEAWVEDLSPEIAFKIIAGQIAAGALVVDDGVMQNGYIKNAHITDCSVAKLIAGIITAGNIYLGADSNIHLDGANQKITIHDGTRDRVILGKLASGWGIEIYDANGNTILNSGGVSASMVSGLGAFALVDQISAANIDTYMGSAAISEAYLGAASVGNANIKDYIKSTDYDGSVDGGTTGSLGWIINKDAKAIFNNIYARGNVEASRLKANTLMVNEGNINNLQVTTLKIGDNAVTLPVSAYNASAQSWSTDTHNEVISVSIQTYGQPIFLWFSFVQTGASGTLPEARVYRGSTIIWDSGDVGDLSIGYRELWQLTFTDTPSSGTYTYKLTMNPGGTTSAGAKWRHALLLGLRK